MPSVTIAVWREAQEQDNELQVSYTNSVIDQASQLLLSENSRKKNQFQLLVPKCFVEKLLFYAHDQSQHVCEGKVIALLADYTRPRKNKSIKSYVSGCI